MRALAAEVSTFFGRRREVRAINEVVALGTVVTLTGIGGVGKTRLAERVAAMHSEDLGDRVWVVTLEELFDSRWLVSKVCRELGLGAEASTLANLVGFLSEEPSLIVLDNCEHLRTACADLVTDLIASCPTLAVLCTSREPLGIPHERVLPVNPLAVPPADTELEWDLETYDSVALFVERARARDAGFALTDSNARAVAQLCSALEGIPLSLELAAARIRVLSPEAMLGMLEDRYRLLTTGYADSAARLRSLEASMDWTWELCTPDERRLWSHLSVFVGGFDVDGAVAVFGADGRGGSEDHVTGLLASLVDKALLSREPASHDRFGMLETVRQYGARRLASGDGTEPALDQRDNWVLELAESFDRHWIGPHQVEWADRIGWHEGNIRATLARSSEDPAAARLALRVCTALESFWIMAGIFTEPRTWLRGALASGAGSAAERSKAYALDAQLAIIRRELDDARVQLEQARELSVLADDQAVTAYVDYVAGLWALLTGALGDAVVLLQVSLEARRSLGAVTSTIPILSSLSLAFTFQGDRERAAGARTECLELTQSLGERSQRSWALWTLGLDLVQQVNLDAAEVVLREALELKIGLRDHVGSALVFDAMAALAAQRGDLRRAAALLGAAEGVWLRSAATPRDHPLLAQPRHQVETRLASARDRDALAEVRRAAVSWPLADAVSLALGGSASPAGPPIAADLSARELEVASLVAQGLSDREIAGRLVISVRTVHGHVRRVLRKLGLANRTQVATWMAARGNALAATGAHRQL